MNRRSAEPAFEALPWQLESAAAAPSWLQRGLQLLGEKAEPAAELAAVQAKRPAPAAASVLLRWQAGEPVHTAAPTAAPITAPTHAEALPTFLLTDRHGRPLDGKWPLLQELTAGQGVALLLWQQCSRTGWRLLQGVRLAAGHRYSEARCGLPRALSLLLASVRRKDLLGSTDKLPTPMRENWVQAEAVQPAQALSALQVRSCLLAGAWRAWLAVQRSRLLREEWRIGVIDAPVHKLLQGESVPAPRWLATPPGLGYWADPMGLGLQHNHLVCEHYSELTGLGSIERLELDAQGAVVQRRLLPVGDGKHASFPLLVQIDDRLLGVAETAALRECVIHEVDAGGDWHPVAQVLQGIAAADPVLFPWQGLYWLAYTDIDIGEMDNLCLQSAPHLQGPWTEHPMNPVKVDIGGARMAGGMLLHESQLYRPAQNCLGVYGAGVQIQRILKLSPTEFEEEPVRPLNPDPSGPCPDGLHTLSAWGERTLIDGKRYVFSPWVVWWKLRRRFGRSATP